MEKEGWITWFTWEANKVPDKELAPSTLGHRCPLEYQGMPCLGLPLAWILKAGASKYTWSASTPQMGIQPEIRKETQGKPVQWLAPSSIVQKAFYTFDKTWRSVGNTKLCSVSSPDSYQNQAFLFAYLIVYTSLRWFTSSSGRKGPINILQPFFW